jgi:hypothetical protein
MRVNLIIMMALLALGSLASQDEPPPMEGDGQQQERPKAKMAPEAQRITLESVSAECFDSVYAVLNGEAEQSSLSEACLKEMSDGYQKSPMGALQHRETMATQTAGIVRLSLPCRAEFIRAAQPKEGEEPAQPTEKCVEEFQKHYRDMQQWVASATLSRLTKECRTQAEAGEIGAECEQEFVLLKPEILATLETQNEQKAKETPKEEKKRNGTSSEQRKKRVKPEPPLVDPNLLFVLFWTVAVGGLIGYTCLQYYKNPAPVREAAAAANATPQKSKTQLKKEARGRRPF